MDQKVVVWVGRYVEGWVGVWGDGSVGAGLMGLLSGRMGILDEWMDG